MNGLSIDVEEEVNILLLSPYRCDPTGGPLTIILYYRDPLLCLQYLMHSPLVQDHILFSLFKLYESAAKTMRIYTE